MSTRVRAARLAETYLALGDEGRTAFLRMIASEFSPDPKLPLEVWPRRSEELGPQARDELKENVTNNATALEAVAAMARQTFALNPDVQPIASYLAERHYRRKHGPNAYYGQKR